MWNETFTCNICNATRNAANHWKLALLVVGENLRRLQFEDWNEASARRDDVAHICGADCAHTLLSRFLETGTFDAPAVRSETAQKVSAQ